MSAVSRREFLHASAVAAAATALTPATLASDGVAKRGTVVISSANGVAATERAAQVINDGGDTLDAVIAGVNIVENDPEDMSVGYGGLPNEDGIVELDSCVMHGPSCGAGSVAALRNVKNPSKVAQLVMQRTDHCMIVGEGALRFARAHGFEEVNLLTDKARKVWLRWKETHSNRDDWIGAADDRESRNNDPLPFTYGTINCCALNVDGDLSGVTTTSGLSYKIPGRVGDSPIIGAGLYVDNTVGAAGATGRGEAVIKSCGAHTIVEAMRHGKSPEDACLLALQRIVDTTTETRLKKADGKPAFDVKYYAVSKDGRFGSAALWSGAKFAVYSDGRNRLEEAAYLYKRAAKK